MKALFQTVKRDFNKDRLHKVRDMVRGNEISEDSFKKCYLKHKSKLVMKAKDIRQLSDNEIKEIAMCGAYALQKDMPKFLDRSELDILDLDKFLNFDLKTLYSPSTNEFRKLRTGLNFLDSFTRKYYTNVSRTDGALGDSLEKMYEVYCISLHLATPETRMNTTRLFSSYTHASHNRLQFASNFNALISAYLYNEYGLKSAKARKDKTVYLHSSSEGWLSRMLSSLLVAVKNPDYKVVYRSIDPNIKVVQAFHECRDFLKKYTKVKNWDAEIYNAGSEQGESYINTVKIDCSFTSPPYLHLEKYPDTAVIHLLNGSTVKISHLDNIFISKNGSDIEIPVPELSIGDTIIYSGKKQKVKNIGLTNQVATLYRTPRKFDEFFMRPTIQHIHSKNVPSGYLILNVVNFKDHKRFEENTVEIATETGYKLVETKRYPLIRKPASSGKKDANGNNIRLADVKNNYEPIFVFQKLL